METPVPLGPQLRIELAPFFAGPDGGAVSEPNDEGVLIAADNAIGRSTGPDIVDQVGLSMDYSKNWNAEISEPAAGSYTGTVYAEDISGTMFDDRIFGTIEDDTILGEAGDDKLYGNLGDDWLFGGADNDKLWGEEGDDQLFGGGGADTLNGGLGIDHLEGGAGDDRYVVDHDEDIIIEATDGGTDEVRSSTISLDLFWYENVENVNVTGDEDLDVTGNNGDNRLLGNSGNNVLAGLGNSDVLKAGDGNDYLFGGSGNDALKGNDGNDRLVGGSGNDSLNGGRGRDLLVGGQGVDVFVFSNLDTSGTTISTRDMIADFVQGEDRLHLAGIDASTTDVGNQAFDFIGADEFNGVSGELRQVQIGSRTHLQADSDGDGISDFELGLTGLFTLTSADIAF